MLMHVFNNEQYEFSKNMTTSIILSQDEFVYLRRAFNSHDDDNDGKLSLDGVMSSLKDLGHTLSMRELKGLIGMISPSSTSECNEYLIEFNEFVTLLQLVKESLCEANFLTRTISGSKRSPFLEIVRKHMINNYEEIYLAEEEFHRLKEVFKKYDITNNSLLRHCEVRHAIRALGYAINNEKTEMLFKEFDSNFDGAIDFEEFVRLVVTLKAIVDVAAR